MKTLLRMMVVLGPVGMPATVGRGSWYLVGDGRNRAHGCGPGRQPLLFLLQTLALAREAALLLFLLAGNAHHAEGAQVAVDVAIQAIGQGRGIALVGFDFPAVFIPIARTHDIIGDAHFLQLAVERVTKRAGFVTGEDLLGLPQLPGAPEQEWPRLEPLRGLGRAAIDNARDHEKGQMHIHSQFDGFGFGRGGRRRGLALWLGLLLTIYVFVRYIHRASGVVDFPALDDPCYLYSLQVETDLTFRSVPRHLVFMKITSTKTKLEVLADDVDLRVRKRLVQAKR